MISRLLVVLCVLVLCSCSEKRQRPTSQQAAEIRSRMVNVNRIMVTGDADSIDRVIKKGNWGLSQARTGLWYRVYSVGKGDSARTGCLVTLSYRVSLLD